jgi:hypothetical protein
MLLRKIYMQLIKNNFYLKPLYLLLIYFYLHYYRTIKIYLVHYNYFIFLKH